MTTLAHVCDRNLPAALDLLAERDLARCGREVVPLDRAIEDALIPLAQGAARGKILVDPQVDDISDRTGVAVCGQGRMGRPIAPGSPAAGSHRRSGIGAPVRADAWPREAVRAPRHAGEAGGGADVVSRCSPTVPRSSVFEGRTGSWPGWPRCRGRRLSTTGADYARQAAALCRRPASASSTPRSAAAPPSPSAARSASWSGASRRPGPGPSGARAVRRDDRPCRPPAPARPRRSASTGCCTRSAPRWRRAWSPRRRPACPGRRSSTSWPGSPRQHVPRLQAGGLPRPRRRAGRLRPDDRHQGPAPGRRGQPRRTPAGVGPRANPAAALPGARGRLRRQGHGSHDRVDRQPGRRRPLRRTRRPNPRKGSDMGIHTYGTNAVDWEQRLDLDRLRTERLARLRAELTGRRSAPCWPSTSPTSAT